MTDVSTLVFLYPLKGFLTYYGVNVKCVRHSASSNGVTKKKVMEYKTLNVYEYIRDMITINTLGVDAPLHIAETNKRIAHIEATRNTNWHYPAPSLQEWVEAQQEVYRVSGIIKKTFFSAGLHIRNEKAAELYPINVKSEIAEYAQQLAYRIASKL